MAIISREHGGTITLSNEERQQAINTGSLACPGCNCLMVYLKPKYRQDKDEFYCPNCHLSAPLFNKMGVIRR